MHIQQYEKERTMHVVCQGQSREADEVETKQWRHL